MVAHKSDLPRDVRGRLRYLAQGIEIARSEDEARAIEWAVYIEALDAIAKLPRQSLGYGPRYAKAAHRYVRAARKKRVAELR